MNFDELWAAASAAATTAGEKCQPTAMLVQQVNPFSGEVLKTYPPVMDGPCGFAYVKIKPANSPFARWLKLKNIGYKAYGGGWEVSIHAFGQSYERKSAAAYAMARVLSDAGINAFSHSRMD